MCTKPITIYNKAYLRLGGPMFLNVPCGQCEECTKVKSIDYFLRTWAIYRQLPPSWSMWFSTLTFNPENLPTSDLVVKGSLDDIPENVKHGKVLHGQIYWQTDEKYMCFDHTVVKRFLKSFRQHFVRDLHLPAPKCLVTSEFGDKFGRPHYHGIFFVPKLYADWREFQQELNRYWHYGFTKNAALTSIDGIVTERSVENAIKYVLKYVTKSASKLPFYLNHDETLLHSVDKVNSTPRIFTTNHYGEELTNMLTSQNYIDNKVTLDINGKWKTFQIPAYYRRKYFTQSSIVSDEKIEKQTYHDSHKQCHKRKQEISYINDYQSVRRRMYERMARDEYQRANIDGLSVGCSLEQYIDWRLCDYDSPSYKKYEIVEKFVKETKYENLTYEMWLNDCVRKINVVTLRQNNGKDGNIFSVNSSCVAIAAHSVARRLGLLANRLCKQEAQRHASERFREQHHLVEFE